MAGARVNGRVDTHRTRYINAPGARGSRPAGAASGCASRRRACRSPWWTASGPAGWCFVVGLVTGDPIFRKQPRAAHSTICTWNSASSSCEAISAPMALPPHFTWKVACVWSRPSIPSRLELSPPPPLLPAGFLPPAAAPSSSSASSSMARSSMGATSGWATSACTTSRAAW